MVTEERSIAPESLARRMAELIREYLPGMDTGAAEPTDRRICWNKTLRSLLTAMGKEHGLSVEVDATAHAHGDEQLDLAWKRGDGAVLAATTGWGDRNGLERRLQRFEGLKARQKLFIFTCSRWHDAVMEQINAALLRYPLHVEGEQYLFVNLMGSEKKMHVHLADIRANGTIAAYDPRLLQPLKGSPFQW